MNLEMCKNYEVCSAPLCPLDQESLSSLWCADEEICNNTKHTHHRWIKNQRKVARKDKEALGYYTVSMLDRRMTIKKGITGLGPDEEEEEQLKKWLRGHPERPKKILSAEHLEALQKGLQKSKISLKSASE